MCRRENDYLKARLPLILLAVLLSLPAWFPAGDGSVRAQGQSTVLDVVQDTYVALGVNQPQGNQQNMYAGYQNNVTSISLLEFELPMDQIGADATITSAVLEVYCVRSEPAGAPAMRFDVSPLVAEWDENNVVYQNAPPYRAKPSASSGVTVEWTNCDEVTRAWKAVDITEIAQKWYNGRLPNNGLEIAPTALSGNQRLTFRQRGAEPPYPLGFRPRLRLSWTGGQTPTPSITLTRPPSDTPPPTNTITPTNTLPATLTATPTDSPEVTATATATRTPVASDTPEGPANGIYLPLVQKGWALVPRPEE
jgi:hypothetical protein